MERLKHYLYSRKNIVASALAIAGLALHFMGLLSGGVLWLPIVIGLYAAGALLVPGEPELNISLDASADAAQIRRGLDQLVKQTKGRVAPDIQARVESIRDEIMVTTEGQGGLAAGDPTVHLIRQTALDYLPTALTSYLALPRQFAERRAVAGGRTPHDELLSQLDLMDSKMKDAADAILAHDSEKLLANGRFLADRFATSSLDLTASGAGAPPAAPSIAVPDPATARQQVTLTPPVAEAQTAAERERVH